MFVWIYFSLFYYYTFNRVWNPVLRLWGKHGWSVEKTGKRLKWRKTVSAIKTFYSFIYSLIISKPSMNWCFKGALSYFFLNAFDRSVGPCPKTHLQLISSKGVCFVIIARRERSIWVYKTDNSRSNIDIENWKIKKRKVEEQNIKKKGYDQARGRTCINIKAAFPW